MAWPPDFRWPDAFFGHFCSRPCELYQTSPVKIEEAKIAPRMTRRLFLYAATLILMPTIAAAHDYRAGSIFITHPWARATPKGAQVGGGYMKITNQGTTPDRLIGGSLSTARQAGIHEMRMEGSVMKMRMLNQGLDLKPGATIELVPGSLHMMFEGLQAPLVEGHRVKGTLVFEKAGTVEIEYAVEGMGAGSAAPEGPNSQHNH